MHSYQQGRRGIRPAPSRPRPLPPGMGTALCKFYPSGACTRGESCLYRHTTSPDKNSSAAGKNFAPARRYVQHPQATAGAAPSTPSPSRRSVRAPPISSGGRERAHAPTQLTPIPGTSRGAYAGGHGGQTDSTSNNANGAVKDDGSARKSCPTSSAPKHGGKGKTSSSRRSTSPVKKKYRRGLNKAFGAASAAAAGQPDMSCWAPASDQPYMDVDDKIGRDNVQIRPSDEDLTKPVAVQDGIPTATNTNATGTNTITNAGDDMTMTRADDREGVTVVGNDPSADGHNGTNHDYDRAPQAPTFNSKPSSKGTRDDDDDDDEEEQDNFLAKYWHESIQMSIFTHEDVAEILKKSGKAQVVVVPRARKETHSSVQGEKAHEQPMPDDDDDSKDGTISINVDNNVSNQGTDEPTADKVADTNGADKGGVTDATVGTGTAEQEDAKDDQGTNINKTKAIVVRYDVDTVDPKRKYCRCFCPPGVTQAKIDLPCPNFDNCSVLCCPYEHKTRDTFEIRMAERGLSMDDLFMGVHDEKSHIPYDYNDEEGRISPRVEVNTTSIMNVLCKMTSPSGVSTDSPSSEDTFILCQPVASADTSATTSSITSSDVEDFGRNPIECVADLYCYENGEILFLSPPSIPNDPRTKEELYWENPEAYSRESIERSKNDVVPPQSKTGTRLNPSATEFVPSTPTSTAKTTIVHVDVEGGKRQICTPAGKSDANSTPGCNLSFGTPSDGNDEASETKDDQKQLSNGTETGTTRANTKDSTSIPLLSKNSKGTGSKVPAQADAQATSTDECPYVAEKNTDPTPIDDAVNTDDTDAASEVAALSIPQDKNVPEQSRERSGAFDLSRNVSPPASSWSSPTRFQGTDKEVMVAIRKSDRELNFLAAMKSKPKKPDHPECDLPTSTTCASTPATPHDKKKKGKKRSGDTLSLKLRVRQERKPHKSHKKPIKVADDKKNAAADTIVSQEPPSQPKSESKPKPKPKPKFESSSGIKKKVKATTMATPTANVLSGSLSDPSNSSSSDNSTDTILAEPSVDDCVKQMEEMQFSSSVISQTEADFRSRKPGSWTEGDLFGFACYLAKQEELNSAALEEPSLNEQNDTSTSSGRLASHAKLEGGLEKTKDAEDDPANQTGDKKKEATKKSKAAAKNRRRRKNKANKASESKTNTTPSEPAATPSKGGEGTRKKNGQNIPKKEVENRMEQDSKTPTSPELLEPADSGGRIDQSITEPSPEAKKRFRFWSAEQFHRDLYIKNLLKLISCEYCRLQHCESPEDTSSNDVLVEAFKKECTRVYETLYKYRTGPKSTVMVADDHPTLAGRRGRIVASDLAKHEFEVEFHRSKTEKIVNKTNTMSEVNDDDTYDLLDVDTDARSSFTRLKISAYDLALPESASNKGKGRNNKKAKNNKSTAQSSRPAQCTLNIEEDEAHDIHGFGMVVRASTLNELAGLKDSEILEHRLSEIMQTSDEQEEAAKVLEEQKEQAKIRDAEKREKQEIAKRFRQYEKQINGRSKKARRILSSGESKFMKGLKTKPEPPEKLYCDSDSLTSSIRNGFVDFLVTVHEGENEHEALELTEAIEEAQYFPNAVEYDESSETTRTCFFFEVDNHKIPLCIVDHKCQQIPDSREIPSSKKEEADVLMSHIMEQDQLDELCSETGLPKSDAYMLVNALIHFEMGSPQEFEIPHRVVRRLIKRDFLDRDFVREVFSGNEEVGHAQTQLILRAASQRLSKRLSFDLSDRVRKLVHNMEFEGEQASDSDQDSDDSGSTEEQNDRPLSNLIDPSLFKKFCKVTGLNESDALQIVMLYLNLLSRLGKTPCQEFDRLSELCLGKLFDSGFLDNRLAMEFLNIDGGSMSGDMLLLTLVDQILQGRHKFSLSDLILADLEPHVCGVVVDDLHQCFIEELQPDDDESTRADDEDEDEVEVLGEEDNEIVDASDDKTESSVDDEENNEDSV